MTKRLLAIVLCVCLLIPTMGLTCAQTAGAQEEYVIAPIAYRISGTYKGGSGTSISAYAAFDPVDLSPYGVDVTGAGSIPKGKVGLSLDVFIGGEAAGIKPIINGGLSGQIELCSGGNCDIGERSTTPAAIKWKANEWNRCVIDLSVLVNATDSTGKTPFDSKAINYFRMYMRPPASTAGYSFTVKIRNVKLVNLQAEAPTLEEDPLGDGSFVPDEPEWSEYTMDNGDVIVAAYNAADYAKEHGIEAKDWAPVFNSLLEGAQKAGGGTVYVPTGVWPCYGEITVPTGCALCGDWEVPDGKSPIGGTILAYYGKSAKDGNTTPFVTLSQSSKAQGLAFWYPEQSERTLTNYPATVQVGQNGLTYACAQDITLINSWVGITTAASAACPNMFHIYGTPLYEGIHVESIQDIMRTEEIHFSPDYWLNSGLFTGDADTLRNRVHQMGRALWFGRTDWSYLTDVYVDGYHTGVEYDSTAAYGQAFNVHFSNCTYAIVGTLTKEVGEQFTNLTITDCEWGIFTAANTSAATFLLQNADIRANTAIDLNANDAKISLVNSIVSGGINANAGCLIVSNTDFIDEEPWVSMGKAARAIFTGNRGLKLGHIDNPGTGNLTFRKAALDTAEIDLSEEQLAAARRQTRTVKNQKITVATGLDETGETDVSAALQVQLNALAAKGGVLFLPGGHYRLESGVTVPQGVELRGVCDFAQMPFNIGTVFDVICRDEPAVTLAPGDGGEETCSGVRAITFFYPEQIPDDFYKNDPVGPEAYDFAVWAEDADFAYAVNVSLVNAFNGIAFTRCDDHFIDGLVGACLNCGVRVADCARGIVRDVQFNTHSCTVNSFGWPNEIQRHNDSGSTLAKRFPYDGGDSQTGADEFTSYQFYGEYQQHNSEKFVMDNVTDQMLFGCFTYSGVTALKVTGDDTTLTVIGTAADYVSCFADIEGGRQIDLINSQMTPFVYIARTITKAENIYGVRLGSGFTGTVNMLGAEVWERSEAPFKVEGGTLNATSLIVTSGDGGNTDTWVSVPDIVIADVADTAKAHITDMFQTCEGVQIGRSDTIESSFCAAAHRDAVNSRSYYLPDSEAAVDNAPTGDVNADEKIDSTDARLILQYYAKKIDEQGLDTDQADVNGDGKVDSTDARLILQLYAKKIDEFPIA